MMEMRPFAGALILALGLPGAPPARAPEGSGTLLGTLRGRVTFEKPPRRRPAALVVTTLKPRASSGARDAPKFRLSCPLGEDGRWSCEVPASTYDLGLSLEGFAPTYRWNVAVSPRSPLDLGSLPFRTGGSVAGWIEVQGGAVDAKSCEARLVPTLAPLGAKVEARETSEQKEVVAPCRPEGLFQLSGLEPGLYDLSVSQSGFTPFRQGGVAVFRDAESFLQKAAVLRKSLRLRLQVSPPLDPYGQAWRIRAFERAQGGRPGSEAFAGRADDSGLLERAEVQPGFYRLVAETSQGERMAALDDLPVDGIGDAYAEIRADWIEVEGRLRVGRGGRAGTLWFGGRQANAGLRMQADEEGRFSGFLPRELGRRWLVEVETESRAVRRWIDVVPNDRRKARLEISLPENRVFGRVLDEAGRPVRDAEVLLENLLPGEAPEFPALAETDGEGRFEARSLVPGRLTVQAEGGAPKAYSDSLEVEVEEDGETGPLELRLREGRSVRGRLVGPFGAVAGAPLVGFGVPETRSLETGRTDGDGRFELRVPRGGAEAVVVASAPGLALTAFLLPNGKAEADFEVPGKGGTLEVVLPGPARRDPPWLSVVLQQNGLLLPLFVWHGWATGAAPQPQPTEERVTYLVPQMAPGSYRLCLSPSGDLTPPPPSARCVSGPLEAGGAARLDLTASKER